MSIAKFQVVDAVRGCATCDGCFTISYTTTARMSWSASHASFRRVAPSGIEIHVNGETRNVPVGTTVSGLIAELGLADRRVAVERNREVVPRAQHPSTVLAADDRLEVVTFVGGG
jgi:sulfur carrier protein